MCTAIEEELYTINSEESEKKQISKKPMLPKPEKPESLLSPPYIVYRSDFDTTLNSKNLLFSKPEETVPYQIFPKIHKDSRGGFSESLTRTVSDWMTPDCYHCAEIISRTKQINRSFSKPGVMRGFHAQKAPFTQGKLIECLSTTPIWDIIIDARPDSKSYQQFTLFKLDCHSMSKVWIPRGFLHGFIVPKYGTKKTQDGKIEVFEYQEDAHIQYFVDNDYDPASEISVNPSILLQIVMEPYCKQFDSDKVTNNDLYGLLRTIAEGLTFSEKDQAKYDFKDFVDERKLEMEQNKLWYCK